MCIAVIALVVSRTAFAADLVPVYLPRGANLWGTTTIGIEASPEFYALSDSSHAAGSYADTEAKLGVTHTFVNNWFVGGLFQVTVKNNNTYQNYVEGSVGYRFNFDQFSLKPSVAIAKYRRCNWARSKQDRQCVLLCFVSSRRPEAQFAMDVEYI